MEENGKVNRINMRYDLVIVYIDEESGESKGEHLIESHRRVEDVGESSKNSRRDMLDYFKEGREVKEGERKELLIKEREFNGEKFVDKGISVIRLNGGGIEYDLNLLHYLSLDKRVDIFTDEELVNMLNNGLFTEEEEQHMLMQLEEVISLYNIRVDGNKWYFLPEEALAVIKSTIAKEGVEDFYSVELLKIFKNDTFESYIIKEFLSAKEGIDFITEEVDISEYGKTLNFENIEVRLGEDLVEEWLIVLNKIERKDEGYVGDVEKVIYKWYEEKEEWGEDDKTLLIGNEKEV